MYCLLYYNRLYCLNNKNIYTLSLNKHILKSLQSDHYVINVFHVGQVLLYFWILLPVPRIKQKVSTLRATDGKNPSSKNWKIIQIYKFEIQAQYVPVLKLPKIIRKPEHQSAALDHFQQTYFKCCQNLFDLLFVPGLSWTRSLFIAILTVNCCFNKSSHLFPLKSSQSNFR